MSLIKKFFSVGSATLASRVLGFAREVLIAATLGAGPVADAFYAAFRLPNAFRRIFAEGAFNSAFVPLFTDELHKKGMESAKHYATQVLTWLVVVLLALTGLAEVFMPFVVWLLVPDFAVDPAKFDLTIILSRIMFPYLVFMSLMAMISGILNALRHYFLAALTPVLLNIVLVGILLVALVIKPTAPYLGHWLAWGVIISGGLQLLMVWLAVRRHGFTLWPDRSSLRAGKSNKNLTKLLKLALPVALTGGIVQINILIGQRIASAQDGAIAILNYADRIYQLPLGLIGIAIGVVLLPELTRALAGNDSAEARLLQAKSLEFGLLLTLPAAAGLATIPHPILQLIYERGAFEHTTTVQTAAALMVFAIGLPSFVMIKIFQQGFFARFEMRVPMWFALMSAIINVLVSITFFGAFGHVAIAMGTTIAGWANALALGGVLVYKGYFKPTNNEMVRLFTIVVAATLLSIALWVINPYLMAAMAQGSILFQLALVFAAIAGAAIFYFGILFGFGIMSLSEFKGFLSRKKQT